MMRVEMSEADERVGITGSLAALGKAAGMRPKGWLGRDYGSQRTRSWPVPASICPRLARATTNPTR